MINLPKIPHGYPDRGIDCEAALKADVFTLLARGQMPSADELEDLAARAGTAGWTSDEIAAALASLNEKFLKVPEWGK